MSLAAASRNSAAQMNGPLGELGAGRRREGEFDGSFWHWSQTSDDCDEYEDLRFIFYLGECDTENYDDVNVIWW